MLGESNGSPFKLPDWPGFHWVALLISVMFDTWFHLIIFTVAGGCAGIFDSKIHRFGCGLFAICEQLIGSITTFATKSLGSQEEP